MYLMYCSNSYLGYSGYKCILLIATIFVLHKQFIHNISFQVCHLLAVISLIFPQGVHKNYLRNSQRISMKNTPLHIESNRHVSKGEAGGAQILADQKAPGSGGEPHYFTHPRSLDFGTCLSKEYENHNCCIFN